MAESHQHESSPRAATSSSNSAARAVRFIMLAALAASIVVVGYMGISAMQERAALRSSQDQLVTFHGLVRAATKQLSTEYTDKDGGMLADPPTDPAAWIDPPSLVLAHYTDADADTQLVDYPALAAKLAAATGKEVTLQEYMNSADEVAAIKAGNIQLVALHAADTPYIVNNAGFIPIAVLGNEAGAHGNHLDIAVPADSPIRSLADVRGHTLTCTAPDSITGYRAAIAVLAEKVGLRPDVDYAVNFSFGQKRSVTGIADGTFEVAALSDDKVQSMIKKGTLDSAAIRVIYESEIIPRLTIGYVYNLTPEVVQKFSTTVLEFDNEGGSLDDDTNRPMRFYASDYPQEFTFVRKIDDSFDPRFHRRPHIPPPPEMSTPPTTPSEQLQVDASTEAPSEALSDAPAATDSAAEAVTQATP